MGNKKDAVAFCDISSAMLYYYVCLYLLKVLKGVHKRCSLHVYTLIYHSCNQDFAFWSLFFNVVSSKCKVATNVTFVKYIKKYCVHSPPNICLLPLSKT